MNENNTTLESLVLNDSFRKWILKKSVEDEKYWNSWVEKNPEKIDLFLQAREIVISLHNAQETITDEEVVREVALISEKIRLEEDLEPNRFLFQSTWFKVAATILLLVISIYAFQLIFKSKETNFYSKIVKGAGEPLIEEVNLSGNSKLINLPDRTTVLLFPGSKLSYPKIFKGKRSVYLEGEAFFEVTKNPQNPFLVHANGLISKVLGTSFTVKAYAEDSVVNVTVKTGKVSVFTEEDQNHKKLTDSPELAGLVLTPNQQVVYNLSNNRMIRTLAKEPVIVNKKTIQQEIFSFNKTPVQQVFKLLQETYGISIIYNEELLDGCELTGELGDEPLLEKMNLICKAIDGTYEMIDAQIIVTNKGCK
jgi:transmembrane sensor